MKWRVQRGLVQGQRDGVSPLIDVQPQAEVKLLQFREVEHPKPALLLDYPDRIGNGFPGRGGNNKPHIQMVFTAVVMSNCGNGIDDRCYFIETLIRYAHGRQGKSAAKPIGIVERPEAGNDPLVQ